MLTISKPVQYGYGPVHDLPTPPSSSRPSPPLVYLDPGQKAPLINPGGSSASDQLMSAPHRGLPPPAALPPVQPPLGSGSSQPPPSLSVGQAAPPPPPAPPQSQALGQLPPAPPWHDDSMKAWLVAKAEEDKRRQEEEKTRQESLRLEQRRTEHEILRTSLQGGIPPPLVPVVFAGIGGGALSPTAWEWAQQFMASQQHPPALMPPGTMSAEHQRRDSHAQGYAQYAASGGVPSTPGSAQAPPSAYASGYPGSPTRPRGQSMPGVLAGGGRPTGGVPNLPNLNTNVPGGPGIASAVAQHSGIAQPQQQQEPQPSPSISFHHWQPPPAQTGGRGGTDQPGTTSGESPRKRKATGTQQPAPPPSASHRHRSPPFSHSTGLSNPPAGRRRGHSRQRSDLGSYRSGGGRGRGESSGTPREMSPPMQASGASSARHSREASSSTQPQHQPQVPPLAPPPPAPQQQQQQAPARTGGPHSVSSLLSDNPPSPPFAPAGGLQSSEGRHLQHQHQQQFQQQFQHHQLQYGEGERRDSLRSSEEQLRGGFQGSTTTRPGESD
ncbi:hypothetical protein VTK56DRAFT_6085 [Thermocarpiscus australiensis]